jgi:succinylglutamic semialdehyde dehydrogenase
MLNSKGNFINTWVKGCGNYFSSYNPATNEQFWKGNTSTKEDVTDAIIAAKQAFSKWSKLTFEERCSFVQKFIDILKANKGTLAKYISYEVGKPLWEAGTEVDAMIGKFAASQEAYIKRNTSISRTMGTGISQTKFKPHGVVAVIGPYNFPGHMPNGHIIPALMSGNTVIFKPSEYTPAVAELTVQYWDEAGLPKGVINLLHGDATVGKILCEACEIKGIFFTGSKNAGEAILDLVKNKKIVALEMGGNSPLVVWDTSNIPAAVLATIQSAFITTGQRCSSARRIIVPKNSFGDEFLSQFSQATKKLVIGMPDADEQPFMGPMKLSSMVDFLLEKQEQYIQKGAIPLLKSIRLDLGASFVTPGIIDVTNMLQKEDIEILGPFVQVIRVDSFDEAISEANNTQYGLAAGIFTENFQLYEKFTDEIEAGLINWNQQLTGASGLAPFGGIKSSGNYRPSGFLAVDYCVYATASIEVNNLQLPESLPKGITL